MSKQNLFLIQSDFSTTPSALAKLEKIYHPEDTVILMGEAVLHQNAEFIQNLDHVYVLETEAENLAQSDLANIQVISYAQFADVVLNFKRSIRLQ